MKALGLSKSTYYHWKHYQTSRHDKQDTILKSQIFEIWKNNYKAYGYPRITIAMRRLGVVIGPNRVYRLMQELGIRSLMGRRFKKPGTHVDYSQRPNLIKNHPIGTIWRADITYLELRPGTWVYLSTIFDQASKQIIAFNIGKEMASKLIIKTLLQALSRASKPTFLHSDMGSQYTSIAYEGLLKRNLIRHSYSKQGYPYDNGPLEAFHSLLKREFIFQTRFTSFEDLVLRVENYINWYNTERIRINGR